MDLLVLFDIDGTLLRIGDRAHREAFELSMREVYGVPATLDDMVLAGLIERQILRRALQPLGITGGAVLDGLPHLVERMGHHYTSRVGPGDRLDWRLPGLPATLLALRDLGATLGVLTGNAATVARPKLGAADLDSHFSVGAYGDEAEERHELVAVAREAAGRRFGREFGADAIVVVGDTPLDIVAARRAGARSVGVATGRWTLDELAAAAPDAVLPDLGDVGAVARALTDR